MAPPHRSETIQREGRTEVAVRGIRKSQFQSVKRAAIICNVPRTTLRRRLQGCPARLGSRSKFRLLLESEEAALIIWIHSMEKRGFPPFLIDVQRMAQTLLSQRPTNKTIGKNWVYKFIQQHPELDTRLARSYDAQRAKNEDPKTLAEWFQRFQSTRLQYGIADEDIYNFDETGFAMGILRLAASKVVVSSDTVGRATVIQPGDRKWVTVIETINASGWCLPPFVILDGKVHQSTWYTTGIPHDWTLAVSDNGWTNDALGLEFIQHFDKWTRDRTSGVYRLLVLDGHGSHSTPEFEQFCAQNKIITICMPPHSSHLLQPLDVACFSALKLTYSKQVRQLAQQGILHIDKQDFLLMYAKARTTIHNELTILSGFRATGLVPFNPDRVLSTITITKTPSPPTTSYGPTSSPWQSETPRNTSQVGKQMHLVQEAIERLSQSPTGPLSKVAKAASTAFSLVALQAQRIAELEAANEYLQSKKKRKKQYIQRGGSLQVQEAIEIVQNRNRVPQPATVDPYEQPRQRAPSRCSRCGSLNHTARTCSLVQYLS